MTKRFGLALIPVALVVSGALSPALPVNRADALAAHESESAQATSSPETIEIDTYFHWPAAGRPADFRNVVQRQLKILNSGIPNTNFRGFGGTGFTFKLHGPPDTRTTRVSAHDRVLEVFVTDKITNYGVSSFPWDFELMDKYDEYDSVRIHPRAFLDGGEPEHHDGKTLVHEVGHWLGLLHPSELACEPPGDRVEDTLPQRKEVTRCTDNPAQLAALAEDIFCPGEPRAAQWKKAMGNPMQSSPETCRTEAFTRDQVARMKAWWKRSRAWVPARTKSP